MNIRKTRTEDGVIVPYVIDLDVAHEYRCSIHTVRHWIETKSDRFEHCIIRVPVGLWSVWKSEYNHEYRAELPYGLMQAAVGMLAVLIDTPEAGKVCQKIIDEIGKPVAPGISIRLTLTDIIGKIESDPKMLEGL